MPVLLTTAYDSGVIDGTHPRMRLYRVNIDMHEQACELILEFGNVVSSVWVPSAKLDKEIFVLRNVYDAAGDPVAGEQHWDSIVSALSNDGEKVYDAIARLAYQWLIAEGHVDGTAE